MKVYVSACSIAVGLLLGSSAAPAAAQTACLSTCTTAHDQCEAGGRDDTACLNAWHQCRVGCSTSKAGPTKLQVTRVSPTTVVIKTATPVKKK